MTREQAIAWILAGGQARTVGTIRIAWRELSAPAEVVIDSMIYAGVAGDVAVLVSGWSVDGVPFDRIDIVRAARWAVLP
jgi:hypothetical protein